MLQYIEYKATRYISIAPDNCYMGIGHYWAIIWVIIVMINTHSA